MKGHYFFTSFFFFLFTLGPALPKALTGHSLLEIQGDIFLFGGEKDSGYISAIYHFKCSSGICSWATLDQALKFARGEIVAIPVPDSFCLEVGDDTTLSATSTTTTLSGACTQYWIGDAHCDDINNNVECNFDGGDCCGANVNTDYCSVCLCLEGGGGESGGTTTSPITTSISGACNQGWIGDDYCDDINNNIDCNFDGGDCCGANVNTDYCDECLCIEE